MPQREANWLQLDDDLKIQAYGLRKYVYATDDTSTTMLVGRKPDGVLDGDVAPDTITSIPISNVDFGQIVKGDYIYVLDPENNRTIEQLICSTDVLQGDTTISVDSQAITNALLDKYIVTLDSRKKLASESIQIGGNYAWSFERVLYCRTTDATITECTTNGLTGSGTSNRIIVPLDSAMTCEFTFTVKQESSANYRKYRREVTFVNDEGTVTMPDPVGTPIADVGTVALIACAVTVTPNNTNDCIKVEFTGLPLTTLNCSVTVRCNISKYG